MPLIILGLIAIVGIVIYGLVIYARSEERDTRPVRERYSHAFPPKKKGANYTIVDDEESDDADRPDSPDHDGNTIYFPSNAEAEKRKRNIH